MSYFFPDGKLTVGDLPLIAGKGHFSLYNLSLFTNRALTKASPLKFARARIACPFDIGDNFFGEEFDFSHVGVARILFFDNLIEFLFPASGELWREEFWILNNLDEFYSFWGGDEGVFLAFDILNFN